MSGNSMDGLDCCVAEINLDQNYQFKYKILNMIKYEYRSRDKTVLKAAIDNYPIIKNNLTEYDNYFGSLMSELIVDQFDKYNIDFISSHGHTIAHKDFDYSIQIGNPKFMFNNYKVPVIYNFRHKDILNHGNGAPLMPFLDWLLFRNLNKSVQVINIGGISNISIIGPRACKDSILGFDMGPGMCLIDKYVNDEFGVAMDKDGNISKRGKVNIKLLKELMRHPFVLKKMPKSASIKDFFSFSKKILSKYTKTSKYDILRTLVAFTSNSIFYNVNSLLNFKTSDTNIILSGGGCMNKTIYKDLSEMFGEQNVCTSKKYGLDPMYKESLLMIALGIARINNLDSNLPSVTGADNKVSLGYIIDNE